MIELQHVYAVGLSAFGLALLAVVVRRPQMFAPRFARNHRLTGLALLTWLFVGAAQLIWPLASIAPSPLWYDLVLGALGTLVTVTAASDFRHHAGVKNDASGTLGEDATVTVSEMKEHVFYQLLNLAQAIYVHALGWCTDLSTRLLLLLLVSSWWLARAQFPVNSFSTNYDGKGLSIFHALLPSTETVDRLYMVKKAQYMTYKFALLHGLNVSLCIDGADIGSTTQWRTYWFCLNTSYVMEFFLQTLVKKGYLTQHWMLRMQQLLMAVSSIAAGVVLLRHVHPEAAVASLALSMVRRKCDTSNTMLVSALSWLCVKINTT